MFTDSEKEFMRMLLVLELQKEKEDLKFYQRNENYKNQIPYAQERVNEIEIMIAKLDA